MFGLALAVVYLCLAALCEGWVLPFTIMLVVPLAVLGALLAQFLRGLANDVFCQVRLGHAGGPRSKARSWWSVRGSCAIKGVDRARSPARGARATAPILMTSFAFILGVVPLVLASGAGAMSRRSLGTAVFGGMLLATFLSLAVIARVLRGDRADPGQQSAVPRASGLGAGPVPDGPAGEPSHSPGR